MSVDKNDIKLDLSEKGRKKDGTVISLDKRLFLQFMAFGDCWNTNEIIKELDLVFSKPFFNSEQEKIKKEIKKAETTQTIKEIQDVVDVLSGWDIETVEEFKETRLDPFNKSLKHRVKPKTIKEVKGALLNNRVKNPVLC